MTNDKCFKKKVVKNTSEAFWTLTSIILLLWPFSIFVMWYLSLQTPTTLSEWSSWFSSTIFGFIITTILTIVWVCLIGFPIIECYIYPTDPTDPKQKQERRVSSNGKIFCPKCGKETDASGKFCQWCGADC